VEQQYALVKPLPKHSSNVQDVTTRLRNNLLVPIVELLNRKEEEKEEKEEVEECEECEEFEEEVEECEVLVVIETNTGVKDQLVTSGAIRLENVLDHGNKSAQYKKEEMV